MSGRFFANTSTADAVKAEDWESVAEMGTYSDEFNSNIIILILAIVVAILAISLIAHLNKVKQRHKEEQQSELNAFHKMVIDAPMLAAKAYRKRVESLQHGIHAWQAHTAPAEVKVNNLDSEIFNLWKPEGTKGGRELDIEVHDKFQAGMRQPVFYAMWNPTWFDDNIPVTQVMKNWASYESPSRIQCSSLEEFAQVYVKAFNGARPADIDCGVSDNFLGASFLSTTFVTICLGDFDIRDRLQEACKASGEEVAQVKAVHENLLQILSYRMEPRKIKQSESDGTATRAMRQIFTNFDVGLPGKTGRDEDGLERDCICYCVADFGRAVSRSSVDSKGDPSKFDDPGVPDVIPANCKTSLNLQQRERFNRLRKAFDKVCDTKAVHVKQGLENAGYLNGIMEAKESFTVGRVSPQELYTAVKTAMRDLDMGATEALELDQLKTLASAFDLFMKDDKGTDRGEHISLEDFGLILHTLGQSPHHKQVSQYSRRFEKEHGQTYMTLPDFITEIFHQVYYMDTERYLHEVFSVFDRDNSGTISREELRAELGKISAGHAHHELDEDHIDALIREADLDHDGTIGLAVRAAEGRLSALSVSL
jgi:calmodulin